MDGIDQRQRRLSERLLLLHELRYSDLDMPYQGVGTHSNKPSRDADTHRDLRLLDAIAISLTTGKPGDVFAAAFDKRERMQLVLAKNGPPTPDDIAAANKLISLIGDPTVTHSTHIFPFLIDRCGENIDKRVRNLHKSIQELQNDFTLALEEYMPEADITAEFPHAGLLLGEYGNRIPPFKALWRDFVQQITSTTARWAKLYAEHNVPAMGNNYSSIVILADALSRSRFLKSLIEDRNLSRNDRKERAEKLKRRLGKVCQYVSGVTDLIQKAKRLFPIPHRWVMDTFTGTGESVFNLCDNVEDAVLRALDVPFLSQQVLIKLDNNFPSISGNWQNQQTIHSRIHAELRIILHLGLPATERAAIQPIGVSKRSCLCCTLWIESHNRIFRTSWMTSGSHGKPYANWALPGAACSYDGLSSVDEAVSKAVSIRLTDTLDWLFPPHTRPSDELFSGGGSDSSDGEQKVLTWQQEAFKGRTKDQYGE